MKKPGLHRSILGDGTAILLHRLSEDHRNTTYGENIGVLAMTRAFSVYIIAGAAVFAIIFGFIGKISAILSSIPTPVMGGISILLFGIIASSGLRMMIDNKMDFGSKTKFNDCFCYSCIRNWWGVYSITRAMCNYQGMALAAIVGVLLNLVLPGREKNDGDIFAE